MSYTDTIAAIATPLGTAALAVIRVSGPEAIKKVNQVFKGKNLEKVKGHTICYGHILDINGEVIDEIMASVFIAPKSFTGENTVELTTHGGILVSQKVLERLLEVGILLAEPGEFSKRAYLNGRIDLVQAEGIMDLISASNENAMKLAHKALNKQTSQLVEDLKQKILTIIAQIEVNIDYPEYDDAILMTEEIILPQTKALLEDINHILKHSKKTQYIREGVKTAIVGKPNVGKSSLLNALLDEDRAIVSEIAGTTRDTIDAYINLSGVTLHLIDTAGIRDTEDTIEKIGVVRSKQAIDEAELILLILDPSRPLEQEDYELLESTKDKTRIIIANKEDMNKKIDIEEAIYISSLNKTGFKALEALILKKLSLNDLNDKDFNYLSNVRHIQKLKEAKASLKEVIESTSLHLPVDMYAIDLTKAWQALGDILGNSHYGDLLTELFSKFCLGK